MSKRRRHHRKHARRNPLTKNQRNLYIAAGIVAAGGVAYLGYRMYKSHQAATWQRASMLRPGQKARVTGEGFTVATLQPILQFAGSTGNVSGVTIYAPGQKRPLDWPADDASAASKFANAASAEFTYTGAAPLPNPFPATVPLWTQTSTALVKAGG